MKNTNLLTKASLICLSFFLLLNSYCQVGINFNGDVPDVSSMLDVKSNTKGILIPRMMETERNTISNPAHGLMVFQTDGEKGFYYNEGIPSSPSWKKLKDNLGNHIAEVNLNMSNYKINNLDDPASSSDAVNASTIQKNSLLYAVATGSSNAYQVNLTPVVTAYTPGMIVHFRANFSNTGSATVNVNSLGPATIKKNFNVDLVSNDILNGQYISVIYDGTNFQILGQLGNASSALPPNSCITSNSITPPAGFTYSGDYTIQRNYWTTKSACPYYTYMYQFGIASVNNKIYCIGGGNNTMSYSDQVLEYDPTTNTWSTKAAMPTARNSLTTSVVNGKIYAIGGITPLGGVGTDVNEEYDPSTNTWSSKQVMPAARYKITSAVVDGKIYVFGGRNTTESKINYEYNPSTNSWSVKTSANAVRPYSIAVTFNNKIYVFNDAGVPLEEYNPAGDSWQIKTTIPTTRSYFGASEIYGKIYVIGGSPETNATEEYDPTLDTWKNQPEIEAMPTPRYYVGVITCNNKIYAIGGMSTNVNEEFAAPVYYYTHCNN